METKGKVILFRKTGAGKSTVANALVTGKIDQHLFPVSDGLRGCTSSLKTAQGRGWEVTDTVGLGESSAGTIESGQAEKQVLEYLETVKGKYSHIVFVKSLEVARFDTMDDQIWKTFMRVFKGAEKAFVILLTRGTQDWLDKNFEDLPLWAKNVGKEKIFVTNLPACSTRPRAEERNKSIRKREIERLEANRLQLVPPGSAYFEPDICKMDSEALVKESKSILVYIMRVVKTVSSVVRALVEMFGIN